MKLNLSDIGELLSGAGHTLYGGETISQLAHALQTAHFAEHAGGDAAAITAALLHDIGHLICEQQDSDIANGIDDQHESAAIIALKSLFDQCVIAPIALHVQAKRYLCATEPDYLASLSPASFQSLQLQGGVMTPAQASQFAKSPYAQDAIFLRRCDDQAKVVDLNTASLKYYLQIASAVCTRKDYA